MSSTAEYDAFGPWIYEIHSAEEIPRLFRSHPIDVEGSLMTIKVPREIERRVANPAMDLYDSVLSLGPDVITVLTRRGREFDAREVAYGEIQGIAVLVDLLRGELTLHVDGAPVMVPFNASSTDIIGHLVQVLRREYVTDSAAHQHGGHRDVPAGVEDDLKNLYRRLAREGGVGRTVAVQKRHVVTPIGASGLGRAVARAWPTTLQSVVVTMSDREIVILHRGQLFSTGRRPVQSLAQSYMPLERLVDVEVRASQAHEAVSKILLRFGRVTHEFFFETDMAERIAGELRGAMRA
jgi:hypothetical protein